MSHDNPTAPMGEAPSNHLQPAADAHVVNDGGENSLRPIAAPRRRVYMIGNAHIDPVWLWPWQEGYQEARATFASVLDRMDEYQDFIFTCDQMVLLAWVEESAPELFERIRARVAEGRWINTGGWWVEPDCNIPGGESLVRQGLLGQNFLGRAFGRPATVGMNADPFGHSAMIPAILRGQGMDCYTFLRPAPHEADLPSLFWWESPDGSRVLAYRIPFEYRSDGGPVANQAARAVAQVHQIDDLMVFYGVGNHGGGPTKANIDSIHRYDRMGTFGRMNMASPEDFFADVQRRLTHGELPDLPVVTGDLQHHATGCYSAQSMIKKEQRRAQHATLTAETWATIANTLEPSCDYPADELENAWKQILFNQFHDILPGSAIETAYIDARDQLGEAVAISKRIITRAQNRIARRVDVPFEEGTSPVLVFNPHPWPVTAVIEMQYMGDIRGAHITDAQGALVPSQKVRPIAATDLLGGAAHAFLSDVPACGYRTYRIRPGEAPWPLTTRSTVSEDGLVLENDRLRVVLDPRTGWLARLLHKDTGCDPVAGAVGEHTAISQDPTDTWGHHSISYAVPGEPMRLASIAIDETGPLRASVIVALEWGRSTLRERLILTAGADHVDVECTLDWQEKAHLLKIRVPVALTDPRATFEIPFGHLERPMSGAEEPGQSWVDLSGRVAGKDAGLSVINDSKHGYDASPADSPTRGWSPSLGITAVRSPVYAWHDPLLLEDPSLYTFQDQGVQRFTLRLVPHGHSWSPAALTRTAAELAQRQRAMIEGAHPGDLASSQSFAGTDELGVQLSAIKHAEDGSGDIIVRAVEREGADHASVRIAFPGANEHVAADFSPFQIKTFRRTRDGSIHETNLLEDPLDSPPQGDSRSGRNRRQNHQQQHDELGIDSPRSAEPTHPEGVSH